MNLRPIEGFPDYQISDTGVVLSRKVQGSAHGRLGPWRELKPGLARNGYRTVNLMLNGKGHSRTVHRLVAEAFLGTCPDGQEVRHLNDVKTDNRLENLCYGTRSQNLLDAVRNGKKAVGEKHYLARLSNDTVREIRRLAAEGMRHCDITRMFGLSAGHVCYIVQRKLYASVT